MEQGMISLAVVYFNAACVTKNAYIFFFYIRSLHKNREEARKLMIAKLDEFFNKEDSVENQRKRLEKIKFSKMQSKNLKLRDLKAKFKEGLDDDKTKNLNLIKEPQ